MVKNNSKQKLPKLYREASRVLQKIREEGGSVKTLVYEAKHPNLKALYALVLETLKHGEQLDHLIRKTQILLKNPKLNPWVARILMTELLWQKKALSPVSPPLEIVLSYKDKFLSELDEGHQETTGSTASAPQVRYVRVNTLKDTVENVVNWFIASGWEEVHHQSNKKKFIDEAQHLSANQFMKDPDIPNLLVFPQDFKFYETELYTHSVILLQDKASCVPPVLLNPLQGTVVLDMCAAPGMKTTQMAALLDNKGKVNAVEINERRFKTLCDTVEKSGATCVRTVNGDVLRHSKDMPDVEYILLDPPCSGSGMVSRKNIFAEEAKKDDVRLAKLANFQCSLLRHAMTNFPNVKRIVYSTCSIHPEENEAVVDSVLKSIPPNFVPKKDPPFTKWMTRGSAEYEFGSCGFYAHPSTHLTNGFFVIVFDRSENDYVPSKPAYKPKEEQKSEPKKKKRKIVARKDAGKKKENATVPDDGVMKLMRAMQKPNGECTVDASQSEETKKKKKMKSKTDDVGGKSDKTEADEGNSDAPRAEKRNKKRSLNADEKTKTSKWTVSQKC